MTPTTWLIAVAVWILCAIGSYMIAKQRGAKDPGSFGAAGFLLGPIGLVIALIGARPAKGEPAAGQPATPSPAGGSLPSPMQPGSMQPSIADELTKLIALRDAGELSPAEFYRQRVNLMSRQPSPPTAPPSTSGLAAASAPATPSTAAPATRSRTAEWVVILLIVAAVAVGIYLLFTGGRLTPPKTIDNANLPPAGSIWFGQAYDPTTFALTGRSSSFPASQPVAMVASLSRETRAEYLAVDVTTTAGEIPVGGGQMEAGNNVMAYRIPNLGVPGTYPITVVDSGGNVLASGTLNVQ